MIQRDQTNASLLQISVIVVAQNVENYIQQCLDSIVAQLDGDSEVIYVDNGSTDETLTLARESLARARRDHAQVIANEKNVGLGPGRNQGIERARGKYLMFVDGDDWIETSALKVLKAEAEVCDPDVLVYNHARFYPDGACITNKKTRHLRAGHIEVPEQRKKLLENLNVAWNKLYRRAFVERHRMRFGPGFYEDIDWNFEALLLAQRLFAIPDVLVFYRQRPGSILRSQDERHFDVFQQWNSVLDFLSEAPELAQTYGAEIERYAHVQLEAVFLAPDRVPEDRKPDFFAAMSEVFQRFASQLPVHPHERKRDRLIKENRLGAYQAFLRYLDAKRPLEKRVERTRTSLTRYVSKKLKPLESSFTSRAYEGFLKLPVKQNRVVFEAYWGKKMDCNPYAIFQELAQIGGYECYWVLRENAADRGDLPYQRVTPGTLHYWYILATSKYFVSNANFPTEMVKRPDTVHVQTKHGTPLKLMGLDIRPVRPKEMKWKDFAIRCQRWDYVISSNPYSSRTWRHGFPYNYQMLQSGYPRNDIFYRATDEDVVAIRARLGIPAGKKVALYAPTFRDWERDAKKATSLEQELEPERVLEALGEDYVLLMRSHYLTRMTSARHRHRVIDASSYVDSNEVCLVSDLLITDYSSIMFDYANLRRPIVLYIYDYEAYRAARGTYFDIREAAPGPCANDQEELLDILRERRFEEPAAIDQLNAFAERFAPFDDGHAAERVVKMVFGVSR